MEAGGSTREEGKGGEIGGGGDGSVRRFPRVQNKPAGICSSYSFARNPSHLFWKEYVGGYVPSESGKRGGFFLPPLKHIMGFGFAKTGKTVC